MMPENGVLQNQTSQTRIPRRIVSLQPSITVTLRDLDQLDRLAACTKYCVDICPEVRAAGCAIVEDSWSSKAEEVLAAKPDLVIASVPYRLESVAEIIKSGVPFLGLAPKCLADVYKDIFMIAHIVSSEKPGETDARAHALVERMQKEIGAVRETVLRTKASQKKPLVYCEEWGKPLILSQTWVAELIGTAGGEFFGNPGTHTTEETVAAANPDVIVAAWCGAGDRVPLEKMILRRGWERTKAAQNGQVYCINDEFLNTPASTLIHGLRALAATIHPETFAKPQVGLRQINPVPQL